MEHRLAVGAPAALPRRDDLGDLADGLLAVADHERVDEVGHGLGVERAVPTGQHDRVLRPTILGPHGHAARSRHSSTFVYTSSAARPKAKTSNSPGVVVGVDREQRHRVGPHLLGHVEPGRVGAFGQGVVAFVQDLVQDLEPLVGQPDFVGVGIDEKPGGELRVMLRTEAPPLHPDVATGLLDPCQEGLHPWPQVRHVGAHATPERPDGITLLGSGETAHARR